MKKIQALMASLLILLSFSVMMKRVEASSTAIIGVSPNQITVQNVGDRFSVNITITNVANLFAYEVKMFYNSTQLDALWISLPSNHFLRPLAGGMFYVMENSTDNAYNATHKFAWFSGTLLPPETARTGSGVLLTIHFNAIAKGGPYALSIAYPGYSYPAKLSNPQIDPFTPPTPIPCTSTPAQITVLPEFPTIIFIAVLLAVTLIAATLGRIARLGKLY